MMDLRVGGAGFAAGIGDRGSMAVIDRGAHDAMQLLH